MSDITLKVSPEVMERASKLQLECHKVCASIKERSPESSHESAQAVWMFTQLAEMQLKHEALLKSIGEISSWIRKRRIMDGNIGGNFLKGQFGTD